MTLLTIPQAAELLGVHPNSIRNWIKDGLIKTTRLGHKLIRIDQNELKRFVGES